MELTPIIGDEYEAYDISYEFNKMGFINNNGNITHSSTSRYTEHIPVRANDMFYYKLVEDNKNSYGIAIYDNDKNFIKGYKISTPETTYRIIKEVCNPYAIPVYDNNQISGICKSNLNNFTVDNCHWNDTAHEMVGKNFAKWLSDTFRFIY